MGSAKRTTSSSGRRCRWLLAVLGTLLLCMPWLVACGPSAEAAPPLKVVATIAPLADWARQVGQDRVIVTQLVPVGVDPETYSPTQADRQALSEANVLLFNGLGLEPWLTVAVDQARPTSMISLELSEFVGTTTRNSAIGRSQLAPDADGAGADRQQQSTLITQPNNSRYLWLDPGPDMAQRSVMLIGDTFARADPDRLLVYRRNAEQYNGELENLDNWIKQQVRSWPRLRVGTRQLLAWQSVDRSWQYFAARYGINLRTTQGLRSIEPALPEATPFFVDHFRYLEGQPLSADLRAPDAVLHPLGDASYIKMIRSNVNLMTHALNKTTSNAAVPLSQQPEVPR